MIKISDCIKYNKINNQISNNSDEIADIDSPILNIN